MSLYKAGDKSRALCPFCKSLRDTTFKVRTVPLSNGAGEVPDLLVGVCDVCDSTMSTLQQSAPSIKAAMNQMTKKTLDRDPWVTCVPGTYVTAPVDCRNPEHEPLPSGWYFWDPFGDSFGPFETEDAATAAKAEHVIL